MSTPPVQPDADGNVTRPQTPAGEVYVPNPPRPEVYTSVVKGDTPPTTQPRQS